MKNSERQAKGWWTAERQRKAVLAALAALAFGLLTYLPPGGRSLIDALERASFDTQMNWLREYHARSAAVDPVLIGIDESTVKAFPEPLPLWHKHLADTLLAVSKAKPAAVGMDIVLPDKSYEKLLPGVQVSLIRALLTARQNAPLLVARTLDDEGKVVDPHPTYKRVLSDENFGLDKIQLDPDKVARRFGELRYVRSGTVPSLAGQIARALGKPVREGYIDYSRGAEIPSYLRMQQVIEWLETDNTAELKRQFDGKVVLIGSLLTDRDRQELPVSLTSWDDADGKSGLTQSGIIVHFQTLRGLLGDGLIRPLPAAATLFLCALLLSVVWLPSSRPVLIWSLLVAPLVLLVFSLSGITANYYLPAVTMLAALWVGVAVRAVADALQNAAEKKNILVQFGGSVSPAVLEEMMSGKMASGVSAETAQVCVMFTDIRGFTALSESLSPEAVTTLLTRYFDRMVDAVHRHGGTMDKFMGDGMMILFGAPKALPDPCGAAVKCGFDMTVALDELNKEFAAEGLPPVEIGIGINYGKVVVGNIGSTERHNYSAIGDAVNVASRLEGLTKRLKTPIVMTESVKVMLGKDFDLIAFGEQALRGHSAMQVWGVNAVPK